MPAGTFAKMIKQGGGVTLRINSKGKEIASERMVIVATDASFKQDHNAIKSPPAHGESVKCARLMRLVRLVVDACNKCFGAISCDFVTIQL